MHVCLLEVTIGEHSGSLSTHITHSLEEISLTAEFSNSDLILWINTNIYKYFPGYSILKDTLLIYSLQSNLLKESI